ncbi:AraC family transcriptional regulator [Nonomuraea sp. NPDC050680]|uniref:AraC family transcriptional regulator n=1 Tax=Nonomuraea sp. NPDC050680 TaxID=3154630 RepID=UPI0034056242
MALLDRGCGKPQVGAGERLIVDRLAAIARQIGYTSEFAFSRAFSRTFGVAPGRYRTSASPDLPQPDGSLR